MNLKLTANEKFFILSIRKGLSKKELAKVLKASRSAIHFWAEPGAIPSAKYKVKIEKELGMSKDDWRKEHEMDLSLSELIYITISRKLISCRDLALETKLDERLIKRISKGVSAESLITVKSKSIKKVLNKIWG